MDPAGVVKRLASSRFLRASVLVGLSAAAATLTGGASSAGPPPVITGIDNYVVAPGQVIGITGDHFDNELTRANCGFSGPPTVVFSALDGSGDHQVQPAGTDSSQCTNSYVRVAVPNIAVGARVWMIDPAGQQSNTSNSGFFPQVTILPTAHLTPSSGPVGSQVTVNGTNLHPPTIAQPAGFSLTLAGQQKSATWGNSISFTPGNNSGGVQVSFNVSGDANNATSPTQTVSVSAGSYTFLPPSLDTGAISGHVVGDRITLNGANLGSGGSVSFPSGGAGQSVSWSSSGIGVTIPPGSQNGPISVSVNGFGPVNGPSISLNPLAKTISPGSASAGQSVKIDGYNFGSAAGLVSSGGVNQTVTSWADQEVVFTLSGDSDTGSTVLTRADGVTTSPLNLGIVPHLDRLESDNLPAGSQVVVDGGSLGSSPGSVKVGNQDGQALLWSRTSVLVGLPAGLAPGKYPVVITNTAGGSSNALTLTIVPGPAASTPGHPGTAGSSGSGGVAAPSFNNDHTFVKPPKPPSPVDLSLDVEPHQAPVGTVADVTVTLKLNGKAVKGAAIQLSMIASPATDYTFTPQSGTTDDNGTFTAKVKISGKPGENVILAQSGVFSDQDHVLGTGGSAAVGTVNPGSSTPWPLIGFGLLACVMLMGGLMLQLHSVRLLAP